jgi:citrate synthase
MPSQDKSSATADVSRQVNDIGYVEREEALAMLGIKKESLYTYVSRGLIKTLPQPGKKTSLYRKSDLEKLRTRAGAKGGAPRVAQVLRYGEPVVQTWVCDITDAGPRYRGHLATTLAREGRSLEFVAELVWGGLPPIRDKPWPAMQDDGAAKACSTLLRGATTMSPIRALAAIALHLSALEAAPDAADNSDFRGRGLRLLNAYAGVSGYFGPKGRHQPETGEVFLAQRMLAGFGLAARADSQDLFRVLNAALVLSVDNELSAPTFCARISASTGVDAFACVAAALMAQAGPMQAGGMTDLEEFLDAVLQDTIDGNSAQSDIPCFDHPIYQKDPRAQVLIELMRELPGALPTRDRLLQVVDRVHDDSGRYPNIFAALVIFSMVLGLPRSAAIYIHSLARSVGWIAHAAEQRLAGVMLRPRARYMGAAGEKLP